MASARTYDCVISTVDTTDATVTTLLTITVPTGAGVVVSATVSAKTATPGIGAYTLVGGFKNVAGTVSQVGAAVASLLVRDAALVTATAVFDVTGATIRIRVTGVIATNITWLGVADCHVN